MEHIDRKKIINDAVTAEMAANDIEDTPEHRYAFLQGLQEAWNEDSNTSIEKSLYQIALMAMIFEARLNVQFPPK